MKNNRKGYAILESAIVMPTIIFVLIFLIFYNFILFSFVLEKSNVQRAARIIAGENSETIYYFNTNKLVKDYKWELENEGILLYKRIIIINSNKYESRIFKGLNLIKVDDVEATIFEETSLIRNIDFVAANLNTKKGNIDGKK